MVCRNPWYLKRHGARKSFLWLLVVSSDLSYLEHPSLSTTRRCPLYCLPREEPTLATMKSSVLVPVVSLLGIGGVKAALPFKPVVPIVPPVDWMSTALDQLVSQNFTQPIDHSNVTVGTFPMRWWYNATFWKGPGSPVVLMTPGELSADGYTGYLTDQTMPGMIAKAIGAAVVMVERKAEALGKNLVRLLTVNRSLLGHFATIRYS